MATRKPQLSAVAQAYQRSKVARDALLAIDAQSMECTEDKAGIVWERFIVLYRDSSDRPQHLSVLLFATPHWWDVFTPITTGKEIQATIDAINSIRATMRKDGK